jgi:hypothetical protein
MRNLQEKLIEKIFKGILNMDVRVLDLSLEDDLDFAIYDEKTHKSLDNDTLMKFAWDFGIFKDDDRWGYMIMIHTSGSYDEPPSSDAIESKETYPTFDGALHALVMNIINENYGNISEETYYLTDEF